MMPTTEVKHGGPFTFPLTKIQLCKYLVIVTYCLKAENTEK